jgi:hypothetical protein
MRKSAGLFMSLLVSAFMLAALTASPVMAQDKAKDAKAAPAEKASTPAKVILENDKLRIQETRYKPGTGGPMMERPGRASYSVRGGTFLRTYPDGKKVKVETKTGEWRWIEKETFSFVNAGKTEIILHTVVPK